MPYTARDSSGFTERPKAAVDDARKVSGVELSARDQEEPTALSLPEGSRSKAEDAQLLRAGVS